MSEIVVKQNIKKDEIRKHVATIHVSGELSLVGRKFFNILLLNAYDELLEFKPHSIPVNILQMMLGWEGSNNYQGLRDTMEELIGTKVKLDLLEDGKPQHDLAALVAYGGIKDGICTYEYSQWMARLLANPDVFAIIDLSIQKMLKGKYSLNLYENCLRFRNIPKTRVIPVTTLRELMGATAPTYDEFKRFSNLVLKDAIAEINAVSDIHVEVKYERVNRKIEGVIFFVTDNPQYSLFRPKTALEAEELKSSDIYRRLRSVGVGEKLALAWLTQEERSSVEYGVAQVEQRMKEGKIKSSPVGYMRTIINSKKGDTEFQKRIKEEPKKKKRAIEQIETKVARDAERALKTARLEAVKALSPEQLDDYFRKYRSEGIGPTTSYIPEKRILSAIHERAAFNAWLQRQMPV